MPLIKADNSASYTPFSLGDIEQEAAALVAGAKRKAAAIVEHAREQAEADRARAFETGLAEGREQGRREGLEEGRAAGEQQAHAEQSAKLQELAAALESTMAAFQAEREALAATASREAAELAVAIAERVCKRAGQFDPGVCAENAAAALRLVMRSLEVKLHVSPRDAGHIRSLLPALGRRWPAIEKMELAEDESITPGGCRVHTAGGFVDAELETQLARIAADLVPERAEGGGRNEISAARSAE